MEGRSNTNVCFAAADAVLFTSVGASQLFCFLQQCSYVSPPPCRQHVTGQCIMHTRPTSKATSLPCRPQALALPSVVIVQNVFNSVNTLRRQMLRKQPQHASNDTALARIGSADAAAPVATPAAASTFTAPQQATASAACTLGGYSKVMPELYSANDASRSQEHNPLPATQSRAVAASQEIFAAKGCSAIVVNDARQVIGSKSSTRSCRACTMLDQRRICGIHHACSVLASYYNTRC